VGQTDGTTSPKHHEPGETGETTGKPNESDESNESARTAPTSMVVPSDPQNPATSPASAFHRPEPGPGAEAPMASTLLNGASLQSTWRLPGLSDNSRPPPASDSASHTPAVDGSGVHSLPAQPARDAPAAQSDAAPSVASPDDSLGLADTQKSTVSVRSPKPAAGAEPAAAEVIGEPKSADAARRGRAPTNRNLGRTLRMELKIARAVFTGESPEASLPPSAAANSGLPRSAWDRQVVSGATQRIGTSNEPEVSSERAPARATDPFGHMAKTRLNPQASFGPRPGNSAPPPLPPRPLGAGTSSDSLPSGRPATPAWAARSLSPSGTPKRAPRAGDRTVITRRGVSKRDWLFMGLLVAALGVTASMLLSYQSASSVEGPEQDATNVEHAVNAAADDPAAQAEPVPANVTEIVSNPPSAEVVFGGAVIGNTPVRVARANFDADYLVRLTGHDPQLVRVNANSPATIVISLKPVAQ
jgi:hypothetical protein